MSIYEVEYDNQLVYSMCEDKIRLVEIFQAGKIKFIGSKIPFFIFTISSTNKECREILLNNSLSISILHFISFLCYVNRLTDQENPLDLERLI